MLEAFARNYELELKYIQTNSTSEVSSLLLREGAPQATNLVFPGTCNLYLFSYFGVLLIFVYFLSFILKRIWELLGS